MIFLIFQIFVYLLLAAAIGGAAGWLLRNLKARQTDEQANRAVHDAKSKLPQLESLLRGRDEQIVKLKAEIKERRQELKDSQNATRAAEQALVAEKQALNKLKQGNEVVKPLELAEDAAGASDSDRIIAELSQEIARLKQALEAQAAVAGGGADVEVLEAELEAMRLQNKQLQKSLADVTEEAQRGRRNVAELERERELQNKSLHVLHQQLDLERSKRLASG